MANFFIGIGVGSVVGGMIGWAIGEALCQEYKQVMFHPKTVNQMMEVNCEMCREESRR